MKNAKITAESDKERIKLWHKNFHELICTQPNILGLEIKTIINNTIYVETGNDIHNDLTNKSHA